MMRSMMVLAMLTAASGIRLRLEDDAPAPFEEEDQGEVNSAVDQEFAFTQAGDDECTQ
jgi:hypothetical protein